MILFMRTVILETKGHLL